MFNVILCSLQSIFKYRHEYQSACINISWDYTKSKSIFLTCLKTFHECKSENVTRFRKHCIKRIFRVD